MEQVGPVQSHINGFVVLQLSQNATSMGLRDLLSSQIQHAIVLVLDSLAGDNPEGMSVRVVNGIRGVFQRLYRYHRNRGSDERRDRYRRDRYRRYIDDLDGMMR